MLQWLDNVEPTASMLIIVVDSSGLLGTFFVNINRGHLRQNVFTSSDCACIMICSTRITNSLRSSHENGTEDVCDVAAAFYSSSVWIHHSYTSPGLHLHFQNKHWNQTSCDILKWLAILYSWQNTLFHRGMIMEADLCWRPPQFMKMFWIWASFVVYDYVSSSFQSQSGTVIYNFLPFSPPVTSTSRHISNQVSHHPWK